MSTITPVNYAVAVSGTSAQFAAAMTRGGGGWCIISSTAAWVRIGATGAAAAVLGTGSFYLPADTYQDIQSNTETLGFVNIIEAAVGVGGVASLIKTEE